MPSAKTLPSGSSTRLFLTDGGLETTLIFLEGWDLRDFAAFDLLRVPGGEQALRGYYESYASLAVKHGVGAVLETATWRCSPDWGTKLGYSPEELRSANQQLVRMLEDIRDRYATAATPIVISGCVGPRGDGYVPGALMSAAEAEAYHAEQIDALAAASVDLVTALTMNYVEEAAGIARAARSAGVPAVISFTVETDGRLPTGQSLREAIEQVDRDTSRYPAYFMINCAHPSHFEGVLDEGGEWVHRLGGLRANASRMSHAELNEAPELDAGNPAELAGAYAALKQHGLAHVNVLGGCCGTDERHVEAIVIACKPHFDGRV